MKVYMLFRAEPFSKVATFPFQLNILFSLKLIIVFFHLLSFYVLIIGAECSFYW